MSSRACSTISVLVLLLSTLLWGQVSPPAAAPTPGMGDTAVVKPKKAGTAAKGEEKAPESADKVKPKKAPEAAKPKWRLEKVGEITGLDTPECVLIEAVSGNGYISNIEPPDEGDARNRFWGDDGKGFISTFKSGGEIKYKKWKRSTPALKFNAPKGMCLATGYLWVADNSRVIRIPVRGGRAVQIDMPGAGRLNDMATDGKVVYISDSENATVFAFERHRIETIKAPKGVNGITVANNRLFAVSWEEHDLFEIELGRRQRVKPFGLAEHFKNLDGIEVLDDGTFIVSDFIGCKLCAVTPDKKSVYVLAEVRTPADIGLDRDRMLLYVPQFTENKVTIFKIEETD